LLLEAKNILHARLLVKQMQPKIAVSFHLLSLALGQHHSHTDNNIIKKILLQQTVFLCAKYLFWA